MSKLLIMFPAALVLAVGLLVACQSKTVSPAGMDPVAVATVLKAQDTRMDVLNKRLSDQESTNHNLISVLEDMTTVLSRLCHRDPAVCNDPKLDTKGT